MFKLVGKTLIFFAFSISIIFISLNHAEAKKSKPIILDESSKKEDVYPGMDIMKEKRNQITIEDITSDDFSNKFVPSTEIKQKKFFLKVKIGFALK